LEANSVLAKKYRPKVFFDRVNVDRNGGVSVVKAPTPRGLASLTSTSTTTALHMSFLPPGGGGGGRQNGTSDGLGEIARGVVTLLVTVAFFASPLGGLVFALFNSFLALAILLPIAAVVGFNVWQYLFTINGACPNCGAPVRVLKDEQSPSVCFTCGSILQVKGDQIYLANLSNNNKMDNRNDVVDDVIIVTEDVEERSVFASWLDDVGGAQRQRPPSSSSSSKSPAAQKMNNVIDVEVE
jgi:hypothetical protein